MKYPSLVRTPEQLKAARKALGLSAEGLTEMVRMGDGRTVRRWESGDSEIPGPVTVILEVAMDFLRQRDEIVRQLELLRSGKMQTGSMHWGGIRENTTETSIARLMDAKTSFEQALGIVTRQPPSPGAESNGVYWFNLARMNPKHEPDQKDSWSLPGETSVEAALAYFAKECRFPHGLRLCDEADSWAEFTLEQRHALRSFVGRSQRVQQGDPIKTFFVARAGD